MVDQRPYLAHGPLVSIFAPGELFAEIIIREAGWGLVLVELMYSLEPGCSRGVEN